MDGKSDEGGMPTILIMKTAFGIVKRRNAKYIWLSLLQCWFLVTGGGGVPLKPWTSAIAD